MRRHRCIMTIALASFLLPLTQVGGSSEVVAETGDTYYTQTINIGSHYRIESDGAPFYIAFDKIRTTGETSRLSYIFDEISYDYADLDKGGLFVSDASSVASSYDTLEYKSFLTAFREAYTADRSTAKWDDYCQDRASFMFKTGIFYSLLFYKGSEEEQTQAIIRDNVANYMQGSLGNYDDTKELNGRYGYYFDGAKITISFLATFLFGYGCTLYYQDGVTVTCDEETVSPTIEAEDYEIQNGDLGDPGSRPFYNRSLCYIPFLKKPEAEDTIVKFDHIEINGEKRDDVAFRQDGSRYFIATKLSSEDTVKIITTKKIIREDKNVTIHDLYDVSGQTEMVFNELRQASLGLGNIPNEVNNAFRFVLNTPKIDGSAWVGERQTKFGIWTSNSSLWSNFGYIIRFSQGVVSILTGEEITLARAESSSITSRSSLLVVIGLTKVSNETGRWFANRVFVDVNGTRVAQYDDDSERKSLGSLITGPYIGEAGGEVSFEDYRKDSLLKVSDLSNETHVKASLPSYVLKGEDLNASFVLDDGYKFNSFLVNGADALSQLVYSDGVYSLDLLDISSAIDISYTLISDVHVSLSLEGEAIDTTYDSFPLYGSRSVIKFGMKEGKVPSSVMVNGLESVSSLERSGKVFSLKLLPLTEDTKIVITGVDKQYSVALSSEEGEHASIKLSSSSVLAGGSLSFEVILDDGYLLAGVSIDGAATLSSSNGIYYLDEVYGDVIISLETKKEESETITPSQSTSLMWLAYLLYALAGLALISFGVFAIVAIKRKKAQ